MLVDILCDVSALPWARGSAWGSWACCTWTFSVRDWSRSSTLPSSSPHPTCLSKVHSHFACQVSFAAHCSKLTKCRLTFFCYYRQRFWLQKQNKWKQQKFCLPISLLVALLMLGFFNTKLFLERYWQEPRTQEVGKEGDFTSDYTVTTWRRTVEAEMKDLKHS